MREAGKGKTVAIHHTPFLGRQSSISSTGNAGERDRRTPQTTPEPPQYQRGRRHLAPFVGRKGRERSERGMREAGKGKTVAIHHTPFLERQSSISSTGNAGGRDRRTPQTTPKTTHRPFRGTKGARAKRAGYAGGGEGQDGRNSRHAVPRTPVINLGNGECPAGNQRPFTKQINQQYRKI